MEKARPRLAEQVKMSIFSHTKLFATIIFRDIANWRKSRSDGRRLGVAAFAAPHIAQSPLATLTSTRTVLNNYTPDSERYNTRSYATRAEPVGRLKSRAVDPRELEVDRATKRREHAEVRDDYRAAGAEDASFPAGSPRDVRSACGQSPEPCDQAYEACSERQQYGNVNMDSLTSQSPNQLSPIYEDESEAQTESFYDAEPEDALLRGLQMDGQSIVLHSPWSSETPHIVITPPPLRSTCDDWVQPDGIWENKLPVQWIGHISVPPTPWQWFVYVPPAPWGPQGGWWYGGGYAPPPPSLIEPCESSATPEPIQEQPWTFNSAEFKRLVALAAQEHLARYQTILPLYRTQLKAVAYAVSELAAQFRKRWDSEDYVKSIERPFVWEDPAAPLLAYYGRNHGIATIVIESPEPFVAPHIVIEDAPPQQTWEADFNKLSKQDLDKLTVPRAAWEVVDNPLESHEDNISLEGIPFELEGYDLGTDSDATLDSVELESPQDMGFQYGSYPVDVDKDYASQYDYASLDCDDDDDGLPSLDDDFYQSTAQRYGIDLHSN